MNRRGFLSLLGGAALTARRVSAQQPSMPVIGFLSTRSPEESPNVVAAFWRGLAENGYAEGQNVAVEYRWARGQYDQLPTLAVELARRPVTVLAATGGEPAARAAIAAKTTIPIVAAFSEDPVANGLVASLNRPGGNVTGVSNLTSTLEAKRLGLLRELVPQAKTIGVLLNPSWPPAQKQLSDLQDAARTIGLQLHVMRASTDREIEAAFESIVQNHLTALSVASDAFFNSRREWLAALAATNTVPAMYGFRDFALAGGLMSYGIDLADVYREIGVYVGRILKGAKPADLPVIQPTKFEFVVNLKAARALGLKFSDNLLSLADEVIE